MMPQNALVNFAREQVDLSIRFGPGEYEGLQSEYLMADHLYPVCHPLYLKEHAITSLDDISHVRLIEDTRADMNWDRWLKIAGKDIKATIPALKYEGAHVVIEGALAVQGVALVRHSLAWKYIEQGLLVKISDIEVCSSYRYWLCAPPAYFKREKVVNFSHWIKKQTSDFWQQSMHGNESTVLMSGLDEEGRVIGC